MFDVEGCPLRHQSLSSATEPGHKKEEEKRWCQCSNRLAVLQDTIEDLHINSFLGLRVHWRRCTVNNDVFRRFPGRNDTKKDNKKTTENDYMMESGPLRRLFGIR